MSSYYAELKNEIQTNFMILKRIGLNLLFIRLLFNELNKVDVGTCGLEPNLRARVGNRRANRHSLGPG